MDMENEESSGAEGFLQVWQGLHIAGLAGLAGALVLLNAEWGPASFVFALGATTLAGILGFFTGAISGRPMLRAVRRLASLRRTSRKGLASVNKDASKPRVRLPSATSDSSNVAIPAGTVDDE